MCFTVLSSLPGLRKGAKGASAARRVPGPCLMNGRPRARPLPPLGLHFLSCPLQHARAARARWRACACCACACAVPARLRMATCICVIFESKSWAPVEAGCLAVAAGFQQRNTTSWSGTGTGQGCPLCVWQQGLVDWRRVGGLINLKNPRVCSLLALYGAHTGNMAPCHAARSVVQCRIIVRQAV